MILTIVLWSVPFSVLFLFIDVGFSFLLLSLLMAPVWMYSYIETTMFDKTLLTKLSDNNVWTEPFIAVFTFI